MKRITTCFLSSGCSGWKTSVFLASFIAALSGPAYAGEQSNNLSVSLALTSEYILRGLSLSDDQPAPQGSVDYTHDSGFYAGIWASSVDLNDGTDAEVDLYGGYSHSYNKITGDIRLYYYLYPGAPSGAQYDFFETYLALTYAADSFSMQASLNATPEYFAHSGSAFYPRFAVTVPVPEYPVAFDAHVARQYMEDNANYGYPDYNEWGLGAVYGTEWADVRAEYIDTDISDTQCPDGCEARGVLTLSHKFTF